MDQRKAILFGKSSFCITLPQTWAKKNKIKKGDTLNVQETARNSLEVFFNKNQSDTTDSIDLEILNQTLEEINSLLLSAYLNGYSIITLIGPNEGKLVGIRKYVNELIAAEVMEVNPNKIVINVLLDIKTINLHSIISRIDNSIRVSFRETVDMLESNKNQHNIMEKRFEIHRQTLLARRATTYALHNSLVAQKFGLSPLELYYISHLTYFFGKIGDYVAEVAEIIDEARREGSLTPKIKEELKPILRYSLDYFEKVLSSYNKYTRREKFTVNNHKKFEESVKNLQEKNFKTKLPALSGCIKTIATNLKEAELVIINLQMVPHQ